MHLALWTRLDILPACVVLVQYQNHPVLIHFAAVKQIVGYLRLHPNLPLAFDQTCFANHLGGSLEFEIDPIDPLSVNFHGPESYHVAIVQLLQAGHAAQEFSVASMYKIDPYQAVHEAPVNVSAKHRDAVTDSNPIKPSVVFLSSTAADTVFGPDSPAPYTESFVDANLPGGIFEKTPYLGFSVSMSGTCVFPYCRKSDTAVENTTEAEMTAGNHLGKALCWLHLFVDILGLAFDGPVPVAEDSFVTCIIAHTGKLTRNTRHIALKTLSLYRLWFENALLNSMLLAPSTITWITSQKLFLFQLSVITAVP
jgi:hypothetical protein